MAKQLPKQVQATVNWMKKNTLIVVFCGIAVAVPLGSYFAADAFSSGVRDEASKLSKVYSDLVTAVNAKTNIEFAGVEPIQLDGPPTNATVEQFSQIITGLAADADKVYEKAKARNASSAGLTPVVSDERIFPKYSREFGSASKVRTQFVDALNERYAQLLNSVRAGGPPTAQEIDERIKTVKARFIQNEARVESADKLTADQQKLLAKELTAARIYECEKVAAGVSFYADIASLGVPKKSDPAIVGLFQKKEDADAQDKFLFELQWQYWIASDVLRALSAVNGVDNSVVRGPVKRLVRLTVQPLDAGKPKPAGEAAPMGEVPVDGSVPADGSAPAASEVAKADDVTLGAPDINPTMDAGRDYAKRHTGRVSNGVYDVRTVEVVLVAETAKLPKVFDAIAAQNFMTIVDAKLEPADPFAAVRMGYIYGAEPVSQITLTIESIWLRDVTAGMMPAATRALLGIASKPVVTGEQPADSGSESAG